MKARRCRTAFTLVEVMLAVLLLALLASAAALSLSQPLRAARSRDAIEQLRSFDGSARQAAVSAGQNIRLLFDLSADTLSRRDGAQLKDLRYQVSLPHGYRVDQVRFAGGTTSTDEATVDISALGFSRSYGLRLRGPQLDQWILFAGLSGDMTQVQDEAALNSLIAKTASVAGHDAD